ncbi:MAG: hypothetical protein GX610_14220 [Rhodococcus sp.]|nr:hypothetical protein [Rhodococcus sp. (in: high G+C Gram-positive bacteria)]
MKTSTPHFTLLAAVTCLLTACTGSGTDTPAITTPTPTPDQNPPYSHVWSAEPGIDLFSRNAELIRGSVEAGFYAYNYSIGTTFPGYLDAVSSSPRRRAWQIQPDFIPSGPGEGSRRPATVHQHLATVTETDGTITADVCQYLEYPEGTIHPGGRIGHEWYVSLKNYGPSAGLAGIPDPDPDTADPRALRVPDWNIFGTWHITDLNVGGRNWRSAVPECTNWWHQRFPDGTTAESYVLMPKGTPRPGSPVAQQYPEWIGPANPE